MGHLRASADRTVFEDINPLTVPDSSYNFEQDLLASELITKKAKESEVYCQHLYAALCNNQFVKDEIFEVLKESHTRFSWRYAGGVVANIRRQGDYLDWYCSSLGDYDNAVAEGTVTEEIKSDINSIGWKIVNE